LIIDSWFDSYVGVVSLVRVVNGRMDIGSRIAVHSTQRRYVVDRLGVFTPRAAERDTLGAGEVGYLIAAIKEIDAAPVCERARRSRSAGIQADPAARLRGALSDQVRRL
jgi:GTP-binding protein LepA